ncbi:DUF2849 domain-containing protein [Rhodobacteraceae bacterium 63075]|nr:DUF2849 domain-containing protein [Rhodobacteraceae bacterium 63075]
MKHKVITANALVEGDVIYLSPEGAWVRDLVEAEIFTDEAVAEDMLLTAAARTGEAVGVYLAEVTPEGAPAHFREAFRASGPSNRFHGKQTQREA